MNNVSHGAWYKSRHSSASITQPQYASHCGQKYSSVGQTIASGILSNIGAALVGGPGIVPGCNMGREVAVFEPGCRHVGLDIKGKDQANPTAMLLSGSMLLRHLGLDEHANRVSKATYAVIAEG